jgi:hypothetical protein
MLFSPLAQLGSKILEESFPGVGRGDSAGVCGDAASLVEEGMLLVAGGSDSNRRDRLLADLVEGHDDEFAAVTA